MSDNVITDGGVSGPSALRHAAVIAGIMFLAHFTTNARADETQVALALGSTIAGEKPCGLDYDQAAIQRYIAKNVSECRWRP